jgi:ASC-1-like (ASCH) protein
MEIYNKSQEPCDVNVGDWIRFRSDTEEKVAKVVEIHEAFRAMIIQIEIDSELHEQAISFNQFLDKENETN